MFPSTKLIRVMGQTLSEPVTEKQSTTCQDSRYLVGSSCMQGWRVSMDDSHTHILSLPDDPGTAFFAVYDGHGGANIAEYAGKHLHKFIIARPEYHLGNIEEALKQGFLDLDQAMLEQDMLQEKVAGSTAVCVLIKERTLYCANVGDSRAIASVRGAVEMLSYDHKPNNEEELRRITAGGGWVQLNRVNGNLALSRALGDYVFKRNYRLSPQEQIVTAYPDVQVRQINDDWEFIVIACDGIWEVLSNEEVISFCRARLVSGWEPAAVCEALMQRCLAPNCATGGLGCDNMTVLIVCLAPFPRQADQGRKAPPRKKSIPPLVRNAPHHFASTNQLSERQIRVKSQDRVYFNKRDNEREYKSSRRLMGGLGLIDPRYFNAYLRSCRDETHTSVRRFYQNACNHSDACGSCDVCHRSDSHATSSSGRTRAVSRKSKKATEKLKLFASFGTF